MAHSIRFYRDKKIVREEHWPDSFLTAKQLVEKAAAVGKYDRIEIKNGSGHVVY